MARHKKSKLGRNKSRQHGFLFRREKGQKRMTTSANGNTPQKSGRLYAMVAFLVLLLAFVAVTFIMLTREARNEQNWIRRSTY